MKSNVFEQKTNAYANYNLDFENERRFLFVYPGGIHRQTILFFLFLFVLFVLRVNI